MRRNAKSFALVCLLLAAAASSAWVLDSPDFEKGVLVGILGTSAVAMSLIAYLSVGGGMSWYLGVLGEEFTEECLAKAVKDGVIWGWVSNVELEAGDIDHAVVAPRGLVALESKYIGGMTIGVDRLTKAADQAARSADKLKSVARSLGKGEPPSVESLVVLWGAASLPAEAIPAAMGGVRVVRGQELPAILAGLRSGIVSEDNAERLLGELRAFRERTGPRRARSG